MAENAQQQQEIPVEVQKEYFEKQRLSRSSHQLDSSSLDPFL